MGNLCAGSEVEEADDMPEGPFHPSYEWQLVGNRAAFQAGLEPVMILFTTAVSRTHTARNGGLMILYSLSSR